MREEFDGDTGRNDEHKGVNVTGNQIFIQNNVHFSFLHVSFYRSKRRGITVKSCVV